MPYHEAYVLSHEVGSKNLNRAAIKCAICRLGSIIPCDSRWCIALSLKCYIWFRFWNCDLFTEKLLNEIIACMHASWLIKNVNWESQGRKLCIKPINKLVNYYSLLVNARVDQDDVSFKAQIWNCVNSRLHWGEITTPVSINTKVRRRVCIRRCKILRKIIADRNFFAVVGAFSMTMAPINVVWNKFCNNIRW